MAFLVSCGPPPPPPPPPAPEARPEWLRELECTGPAVAVAQKAVHLEEEEPGSFRSSFDYPDIETQFQPGIARIINPRIQAWLQEARASFLERVAGSGYWELSASCAATVPARCSEYLTVLCTEVHTASGMATPFRHVTALNYWFTENEVRTFSMSDLCRPDVDCFSGLAQLVRRYAFPSLVFVADRNAANGVQGFVVPFSELTFGEFLLLPDRVRVDLGNLLPVAAGFDSLVDIPTSEFEPLFREEVLAHWRTARRRAPQSPEATRRAAPSP